VTLAGQAKVRTFSVALCGIGGPIIGCAIAGFVNSEPLLIMSSDIAGAPVVLYALIPLAIPGAIIGIFAGHLTVVLIRQGYIDRWKNWQLRSLGAALGGLGGIGLWGMLFMQVDSAWSVLGPAAGAGALCGLLIANYALRTAKRERADVGACATA
jgi:hypothetical protein